jgi:hypothetical protein
MLERRTEKLIVSSTILVVQAIVATVFTFLLMHAVVSLGHRIPARDLPADYLIALFWALALGVAIWLVPFFEEDRTTLILLWVSRVFVALILMLPYESHYGLDSYNYFSYGIGVPMPFAAGRGGTSVMYNLVRLHESILPPLASYHATKLSFAMAGLGGVYIFYRAAVLFLGHKDSRILLILGFTPSLLFWGSILGKDPLTMLGVAIYSYGVVGICKRRRWFYLVWVLAGISLATAIRSWMAPIMAIPLLVVMWHLIPSRATGILFLAACVLVILTELGRMEQMLNLFKAASATELIEQLSKRGQSFEGGGSATGANLAVGSLGQFIRFAPYGIFSALFRPIPGEVLNTFGIMAGLENFVILVLVARAVVRLKRGDLHEIVVVWAISFLLFWALFYGFISSHNMGTAVRYRVQILPLEILLLLYLGRHRGASPIVFPRPAAVRGAV